MEEFILFYTENLRGSLFTAFLTLTGFLFTLHAFLIVTLHRDIYGTEEYQDWVMNVANKYKPGTNPIQPLRNVSRLLFVVLVLSFSTSVAQFTFGLMAEPWAVILCLILAGTTVVAFICTLCMFRTVLNDWLTFIEDEAKKKKSSSH